MNAAVEQPGQGRQAQLFGSKPRWRLILLVVVFALGLGIRLYDLKDLPLDFHAVRQLRSALIARSIYYQVNPKVDLAMRQEAVDTSNLEIYEPPILEGMVGLTYQVIGSEQLWISRIYTSLCWLIGGLALLVLARRFISFDAVLVGLGFYFFLPFSVIASRSFQPDPWMVMWILVFAYTLNRWRETPTWKWALISGLVGGMAVLVKVFAGFFVASMLAAVVLSVLGFRRTFRSLQAWAMAGSVLAPAAVYYLFILKDRSAGFFSFWTLNLGKLIFTSNFYADWLAMVTGLMGLAVVVAAILGMLLAPKALKPFLLGLWAGYGLFGLSSPYQFTTHEYYHLALVPLVALSAMPLLEGILMQMAGQTRLWRLMAVVVFLFSAGYCLYVARSQMYASNFKAEAVAWKRVGEAIPQGSPFVALTNDYGMRLRYFGWRTPTAYWPSSADLNLSAISGSGPMQYADYFKEITNGKQYFLVTAYGELDSQPQLKELLTTRYPVYKEGDGFTLYDLSQPGVP
jgi:4-amino-4-deoxy-L-arabinose transferase-like glycosyltransferase